MAWYHGPGYLESGWKNNRRTHNTMINAAAHACVVNFLVSLLCDQGKARYKNKADRDNDTLTNKAAGSIVLAW